MNVLSKDDKEFLNNLQQEMLTQDTLSQANPRFWVVMQEVKDYEVEDAEGVCVLEDGESVYEGQLEDMMNWLKEQFEEIETIEYCFDCFEIMCEDREEYYIGIYDLEDFLAKYRPNRFTVLPYRAREEIVQNTMFLTNRDCKEHIEANSHHYDKTAHSYAMTAWRSPQVDKLYKILLETDWG